jgi:hypothetical protein
VNTYTKKKSRARIEHKCVLCHRTIRVGEVYTRGAGFGEGTAWSWKECAHCRAALNLYEVYEWDEEGYNEETFDAWVDYRDSAKGMTVAELRAMAGYRAKWQLRSGTLWPIPVAAS